MIDDITAARDDALAAVANAENPDAISAVETTTLGKRGRLATLKTQLGTLDTIDAKREAGRALNDAVTEVTAAVERRRDALRAADDAARIESERIDLTETTSRPTRGHRHLVTQAWERLEDVFVGLGFQVAEGPEVESDWFNFEALNMGEHHPARNEFDTLFTDHVPPGGRPGSAVLRTHTSPVQIRTMLDDEPPIYIVAPGRVFRRDTPDATHLPVFHQIEGLVVDEGISMAHLAGTIEAFTKAFFGSDFTSRLRPSYFPFTEPSAEFDIRTPRGDWLELGGCGMVHPNVLRHGGIDPERWSGFAFGFGIDRMSKERHGVVDIREMFTDDIRFVEQF
ncbi:MAG: phenylalanine--tRNA ligase subunit alpha [Acidimicrobiia bacterium]|nr:phenylalanine--tRNA ligase subunit alpha [Acidimicrobiia bacterium]